MIYQIPEHSNKNLYRSKILLNKPAQLHKNHNENVIMQAFRNLYKQILNMSYLINSQNYYL